MAQSSNRLLDEIARLATDAVGAAQGVRREAETVMRGQLERLLRDMDVATREEVDVLRDMVVAAREENERLEARIAALEARLGAGGA
jgi:BMFP domain-containing protein YqiC